MLYQGGLCVGLALKSKLSYHQRRHGIWRKTITKVISQTIYAPSHDTPSISIIILLLCSVEQLAPSTQSDSHQPKMTHTVISQSILIEFLYIHRKTFLISKVQDSKGFNICPYIGRYNGLCTNKALMKLHSLQCSNEHCI